MLQFENFRKKISIVIGILCVCVVVSLLFFNSSAMKDNKTCRTAIKMIEQYKLDEAEEILDEISLPRAKALKKYINFRREIDSISFVNKVDVELVKKYKNYCEDIILLDEKLGSVIEKDLEQFVANSELAIKTYEIYCDNRDIVSEMYSATEEQGKLKVSERFSFTIAEEREKIYCWEMLYDQYEELIKALDVSYNNELGSGIARLLWILEELPKDIASLKEDMDRASQTYSENERIHYSDGKARAHSLTYGNYNSNDTSSESFLKFAEKELWGLLVYRLDRPLELSTGQTDDGLKYALLADDTVEITGVSIYKDEYNIPEKVTISKKEYFVRRIGEKAFHNHYKVEKISLPETIMCIAPNAFKGCNLGEEINFITVPKYIALNAFDDSTFFICCTSKDTKDEIEDIFGYGLYNLNGEKQEINLAW